MGLKPPKYMWNGDSWASLQVFWSKRESFNFVGHHLHLVFSYYKNTWDGWVIKIDTRWLSFLEAAKSKVTAGRRSVQHWLSLPHRRHRVVTSVVESQAHPPSVRRHPSHLPALKLVHGGKVSMLEWGEHGDPLILTLTLPEFPVWPYLGLGLHCPQQVHTNAHNYRGWDALCRLETSPAYTPPCLRVCLAHSGGFCLFFQAQLQASFQEKPVLWPLPQTTCHSSELSLTPHS